MSGRPSTQLTLAFLAFLAGLTILAATFLPRQPVLDTSLGPTPTPGPFLEPTPTKTGAACLTDATPFLNELAPLMQEWRDITALTAGASNAELGGLIARMQDVRRRADALQAPECALDVQEHLSRALDLAIRAYNAARQGLPGEQVQDQFAQSDIFFNAYRNTLRRIVEPPEDAPAEPPAATNP
jgi:hypothetical protein